MKSRNIRFTTALVTFGLFIALAGLIAPSAFGATAELRFVDPDGLDRRPVSHRTRK